MSEERKTISFLSFISLVVGIVIDSIAIWHHFSVMETQTNLKMDTVLDKLEVTTELLEAETEKNKLLQVVLEHLEQDHNTGINKKEEE